MPKRPKRHSHDEEVCTELPEGVFASELTTVAARREAANLPPLPSIEGSEPNLRRGLVGLALSGGGIRSSTFSLGVIQALATTDAFRRVDYVSTVSGGGYTGSMLSSVLNDPTLARAELPLSKPDGDEEPPALQHLRNGSNYLNPGGLLNTLRLPAVVLRGLVLNALLVLPYLMLLVMLTEYLHEHGGPRTWMHEMLDQSFHMGDTSVGFGVVLLVAAYGLLSWVGRSWTQRNASELVIATTLAVLIAALLAIPMIAAIDAAIQLPLRGEDGLEGMLAHLGHMSWFVIIGICVVGYAVVRAPKNLQRLANKLVLYALGVGGPLVLFGVYLLMLVAQADSPFIDIDGTELESISAEDDRFVLDPALRTALAQKGVEYGSDERVIAVRRGGVWNLPVPGTVPHPEQPTIALQREGDRIRVMGAGLGFWGPPSNQTLMSDKLFCGIALALLLFNLAFLNVNRSSLHGFYRDRLSRLYLFRTRPDGRVEHIDELRLSELNAADTASPYHLINATLNLQGSRSERLRGREADFFLFSKHHCGSPHTGYCETTALEKIDPHVNLGTAMAISAAAAAPNMGSTTVRQLVFVLTMLNLRLGYWLPNPRQVNAGRTLAIRWAGPHTRYLLLEALGALNTQRPLVNVSDGGHLENLAIYELLRRRCELIIAVDAEADPELTFGGLITLMRLAKIDLGIDIDINLDPLRLDEDGESRSHFAIGTIHYGVEDGVPQIGRLLYIKSSFAGDENPFIARYRADFPDFPHETTADQFFDEVQFEAYRALGFHIGSKVIASSLTAGLPGFAPAVSGAPPHGAALASPDVDQPASDPARSA
jgi:predicted acylesterase/phospholipase RssA